DLLRTATRASLRRANRGLSGDVHAPVPFFDLEALNPGEGGRLNGLARSQVEARVVPRAANGFSDDEAFRERSAVVRARRSDGEDFAPAAHEDDGLSVALPEKRLSFDNVGLGNAFLEIGPLELRLAAHQISPTIFSGRTH